HADRLAAHLLQEGNNRENFVLREANRVLIDVRHPGRILLRHPLVAIIQIEVGLRLRQAFEDELAGEFRADTFEVRATGRFARANRVAERALPLAEEDLLPD